MPATTITKEVFPANVNSAELDTLVKLRLKAGAIRSKYTKMSGGGYELITEWNVFGEND